MTTKSTRHKLPALLYALCFLPAFISCKKDIEVIPIKAETKSNFSLDARPNILFIVGDDVGYEIPTFNGGQSYSTINIDKLAKNGIRFTQCHSSPMCAPSRVT